jgi:hypothetical protein
MAMSKPNEIKPFLSFSEDGLKVKLDLVMDGLKTERRLNRMLSVVPKNGMVLSQEFTEQSMNYGLLLNTNNSGQEQKTYRFEIKRLPTPIVHEKTKIKYSNEKVTIRLIKRVNEPWQSFKDSDFETIHLVKN